MTSQACFLANSLKAINSDELRDAGFSTKTRENPLSIALNAVEFNLGSGVAIRAVLKPC